VTQSGYPAEVPFNPALAYPEYPFTKHLAEKANDVYDAFRKLLLLLGFDKDNFGTGNWNPLGHIIKPGMTVLVKPNFVLSSHAEGKDPYSIITHPSVIRALVDYCRIALKGDGKIIIADAPQYNCNFAELLNLTKLDRICEFYGGLGGPQVTSLNLQPYWSPTRHFLSCLKPLQGDPQGTVVCNLGKDSALRDLTSKGKLYGAVYWRNETIANHTRDTNRYEISKTVLNADVFISVPKMKIHKKVGVTLNAKGLVGICPNKNLVPHYRVGLPSEGGDQFPEELLSPIERRIIRFERWMYDHFLAKKNVPMELIHRFIYGFLYLKIAMPLGLKVSDEKRLFDAGNWYGNDTAWRMAVDLLRIIYFADESGTLHKTSRRRMFSVIDGVIGGENKGPLVPDPKPAGVLIGGEDLLAVDIVTTRLMGLDYQKLKQYSRLNGSIYDFGERSNDNIEVVADEQEIVGCLLNRTSRFFDFKPHPGWVGRVEI